MIITLFPIRKFPQLLHDDPSVHNYYDPVYVLELKTAVASVLMHDKSEGHEKGQDCTLAVESQVIW